MTRKALVESMGGPFATPDASLPSQHDGRWRVSQAACRSSLTHGRFSDNSRYAARTKNEASWQAISKGHVRQSKR